MPLFIYTNNVETNIKSIKKYTKKEIMAVVKSNAYGLGANKIIDVLKNANINYFVFEKYEEFKESQYPFTDEKILIMESVNKKIIENETYSNIAYSINNYLDLLIIKDINKKVSVHIRIDTGMNRFGIRNKEEFTKILNVLKSNKNIFIEGLYTHFASDNFESKYYEKQRNIFQEYTNFYNFPIIHANATKTLHRSIIGNYIRIGMGMYGYHQPFIKLKPSISMLIRPTNIFKPNHSSKIGYSQDATSEVVGVIPIGYNEVDLSTIDYIRLNNQKLSIIGKSCMNHTHFIANDNVNYSSWLSIFPNKTVMIDSHDYLFPRRENWYKILTSMKNLKKNYVKTRNFDLSSKVTLNTTFSKINKNSLIIS